MIRNDVTEPTHSSRKGWIAFAAFAAIAAFLLLSEHRAHVLGYLPFALLLACPLLHMFMHGGHGHRHGAAPPAAVQSPPPPATDAHGRHQQD